MATAQQPTDVQEKETTAVATRPAALPQDDGATGSIEVFASHEKFRNAQRMAVALSESNIVPEIYRKNIPNCLVALELASRTGASVLMVMQNLYIVKGRPGWSASFLVGSVNTSGRFSKLRYERKGDDPNADTYQVRAFAKDLSTDDVLVGEWITWKMVKAEGWLAKDGSKWKTMPGQMFLYRAASFWVRAYAPEISLGMQSAEEVEDITENGAPAPRTQSLNEALKAKATATVTAPAAPHTEDVTVETTGEVVEQENNPTSTLVCDACGISGGHLPRCPQDPDGQ